ncbi:hypothetical protein KF728_18420 [Candidatus Obscuribacterales bacterium]|nr:hypothetical protein [Candidatus Obscuribacterales bacterium]
MSFSSPGKGGVLRSALVGSNQLYYSLPNEPRFSLNEYRCAAQFGLDFSLRREEKQPVLRYRILVLLAVLVAARVELRVRYCFTDSGMVPLL